MAVERPDLSVVVTIVDGGEILDRHLAALTAQTGKQTLDIIVPYDHMTGDAADLAEKYPAVRFVDLGTILDGLIPANPLQVHAFYDTRRAEALKLAEGGLIAITEDRGMPAPDWAEAMIRLHRQHPDAVIGGSVENGVDRLANWAIFFCDFGRYQPPLDEVNPEYVTDTNICYKRDALYSVAHLWETVYQEPEVNWELRRRNAGLRLSDAARTVQEREIDGLGSVASERFHWARLFGMVRGREMPRTKCARYALMAPALPVLLFVRHFRRQIKKGQHIGRFIQASPLTLFFLVCWSAGEAVGYLEALGGRSGRATDHAQDAS